MTIRTEDRERVRKQALIVRASGAFRYACDRCRFRREWSTEAGALNGVATHLLQVHRAKLTLEAAGVARASR